MYVCMYVYIYERERETNRDIHRKMSVLSSYETTKRRLLGPESNAEDAIQSLSTGHILLLRRFRLERLALCNSWVQWIFIPPKIGIWSTAMSKKNGMNGLKHQPLRSPQLHHLSTDPMFIYVRSLSPRIATHWVDPPFLDKPVPTKQLELPLIADLQI